MSAVGTAAGRCRCCRRVLPVCVSRFAPHVSMHVSRARLRHSSCSADILLGKGKGNRRKLRNLVPCPRVPCRDTPDITGSTFFAQARSWALVHHPGRLPRVTRGPEETESCRNETRTARQCTVQCSLEVEQSSEVCRVHIKPGILVLNKVIYTNSDRRTAS